MDTRLKLHGSQFKQLTQTQTHPLRHLNAYLDSPRNITSTIFYNNKHSDGLKKGGPVQVMEATI